MENTFPYENFAAAVAAARTAGKNGDLDESARLYRLIPGAFPHKKHAVTIAADGLKGIGLWTEAVAVLETALRGKPQSAMYLWNLSELYREIGDHARAAGYLQRYIDHDPRSAEAWVHLARLHDLGGEAALAEAAYAKALDREPMNVLAALGRGDSLFHLGRVDEAIALYRRAVASAPQDAVALFALGSALRTQGAESEGHDYLRRSLEIDPGNARAHVNLGLTYFNTGNLKGAEASARNALLIDDQLQIAHVLLGLTLAEQGDLPAAANALSRAAASSHHSEALFALAAVQSALGHKSAAELALQRVLAAEPDNGEAKHVLNALHGAPIFAPDESYARETFDRLAQRYDTQELHFRGYNVPAAIADLIEAHEPERHSIVRLADLGCGTGLVAATLHDAFRTETILGIDTSPNMAKIAGAKALYDQILIGDARDIAKLEGTFDVITAGDLFPYLGELAAFMTAARARLAHGGLLAYSIELSQSAPVALGPDGRFVHTPSYVEDAGRAAGLNPVAARAITLRRLFGKDVAGLVGLLQA
ncbi:MAG: tetratricopeptide repeat protein [Proteobacteria bacterium]|nr:tetratricopeptide repeat protein [Pseudomonadota bacterium]